MRRQEIGNQKPDHDRDRLDEGGVFERLEIKFERDRGGKDFCVIVEHESGIKRQPVAVEEVDDDHENQRRHKYEQQHQCERPRLKPGNDRAREGAAPGSAGFARRRFAQGGRQRHAAMNSFQRFVR
jgi:hypothetical protein